MFTLASEKCCFAEQGSPSDLSGQEVGGPRDELSSQGDWRSSRGRGCSSSEVKSMRRIAVLGELAEKSSREPKSPVGR